MAHIRSVWVTRPQFAFLQQLMSRKCASGAGMCTSDTVMQHVNARASRQRADLAPSSVFDLAPCGKFDAKVTKRFPSREAGGAHL